MPQDLKSLGRVAYEAWADAMKWNALNVWESLGSACQEAWEVAAVSVLAANPTDEQADKATLFRRPAARFLTGQALFQILSRYVSLPACQSLTIEASCPGLVNLTTKVVLTHRRDTTVKQPLEES